MKRCLCLFIFCSVFVTIAEAQVSMLSALHPRPKVSYFIGHGSEFTINPLTTIVTDFLPSSGARKGITYLQKAIKSAIGVELPIVTAQSYHGRASAIFIGELDKFSLLTDSIKRLRPEFEGTPSADGYVLQVTSSSILIAGADSNGTFNAVTTLTQLLQAGHDSLPQLHIFDYPDYPVRWVFSQQNLQVAASEKTMEAIEDSMAAHKLNGLMDGDFKNNRLESVPSWYFDNVDSLKKNSYATNTEIVPGVCDIGYSQGILLHDPDLAEGIQTTSSYNIASDRSATLLQDLTIPNAGFENVNGSTFTGWSYYDGPNQSVFVDSVTMHSGKYSARCTNFVAGNSGGNCRFIKYLPSKPFHSYHMSVWTKTDHFAGTFQLLALGAHQGTIALTSTQYSIPATSGSWSKYDVVFNTLYCDSLYVYAGVWGGTTGTIWFDDFQIEDAGLTNILRRPTTMPSVWNTKTGQKYIEGTDFAPLSDSIMYQSLGSYPWHQGPQFTPLAGGRIKAGDLVSVRFYRPFPTLNYQNGDGQAMVCLSEDTLYAILHDQLTRVNTLWNPNKFFMGHDEIRMMNWDSACQSRRMTPAQLLADNVTKCDSLIHLVHPSAESFIWSDMFDSLHNAHANYYLVNGDLTNDWNLIPKDLTIVNWNGNHAASLDFFYRHGFSQITSPYYDSRDTKSIRDWRLAMEGVSNVRGMMYTTWAADYSELTPFADYAWSAGPMIIHTPIDSVSQVGLKSGDSIVVSAHAFADTYDPTDKIVNVSIEEDLDSIRSVTKKLGSGFTADSYVGNIPYTTSGRYRVVAINNQGITRRTPYYKLGIARGASSVASEAAPFHFNLYPVPASIELNLKTSGVPAGAVIEIIADNGVTIRSIRPQNSDGIEHIDVREIPQGHYTVRVATRDGSTLVRNLIIAR